MASGGDQLRLQAILEVTKVTGLDKAVQGAVSLFGGREGGLGRIIQSVEKLNSAIDKARKNTTAYKNAVEILGSATSGAFRDLEGRFRSVGEAVKFSRTFESEIRKMVTSAKKGSKSIGIEFEKILTNIASTFQFRSGEIRGMGLGILSKVIDEETRKLERYENQRSQRSADRRRKKELELKKSQEDAAYALKLTAVKARQERMQEEVNERNRSAAILNEQRFQKKRLQIEEANRKAVEAEARRKMSSRLKSSVSSGQLSQTQADRIERKRQEKEDRNEIRRINEQVKRNYDIASGAYQAEVRNKKLSLQEDERKIQSLRRIERQANGVAKSFDTSHASVKRFGEQIGLATKRFGAFVVGASPIYFLLNSIRVAIQDFTEFERVLTRIEQAANLSSKQIGDLAFNIIGLGTKTGSRTTEIASGAEIFAQAGYQDPKQLLNIATQLSKVPLAATFGTIRETAEGLLAIFGQFNKTTSDTAYILDLVNKYAADFAVESKDIFEGVERGGAAFSAAGGSLEEFVQLFSVLRETTRESASSLGVFFKTGAARLLSGRSQNLLQSLGIGRGSLTEQLSGLSDVFASGKFTDVEKIQISEQLVGKQQFNRLLSLTKALQEPRIRSKIEGAQSGFLGSLDEAAKKRIDDIGLSINRLKESFGAFFNGLTQQDSLKQLFKLLADGAEQIAKLSKLFSDLLPLILAFIGIFVGSKISGPLLKGIGKTLFSNTSSRRFDVLGIAREKYSTYGLRTGSPEIVEQLNNRRQFISQSYEGLRKRGLLNDSPEQISIRNKNRRRNRLLAGGIVGASALTFVDFENLGLSKEKAEGINTVAGSIGTGALVGSTFGPKGAAIGAAVGAVIGLAKAAKEASRNLELLSISSDPTRSGKLQKAIKSGFDADTFKLVQQDLLEKVQRNVDQYNPLDPNLSGDDLDRAKRARTQAAVALALSPQNKEINNAVRSISKEDRETAARLSSRYGEAAGESYIRNKYGQTAADRIKKTVGFGNDLLDPTEKIQRNIDFATEALSGAIKFKTSKTQLQQSINLTNKLANAYFSRLNQYFAETSEVLQGGGLDLESESRFATRSNRQRTDFQGVEGFRRIGGSTLKAFGLSEFFRSSILGRIGSAKNAANTIIGLQQNPQNVLDLIEAFGAEGGTEPRDGVDQERQTTLTETLSALRKISRGSGSSSQTQQQNILTKIDTLLGQGVVDQLFQEIDTEASASGQRPQQLFEDLLKSSNVTAEIMKTRERELQVIEMTNKAVNEANGLLNKQYETVTQLTDQYYNYLSAVDNINDRLKSITRGSSDTVIGVSNSIDQIMLRNSPELALQSQQSANTNTISTLSSRLGIRQDTTSFLSGGAQASFNDIRSLRRLASSQQDDVIRTDLTNKADLAENRFFKDAERALSDLSQEYGILEQVTNSYGEKLNLAAKALDEFTNKLEKAGDFALGLENADLQQKLQDLVGFQSNVAVKGIGGALSGLSRGQINDLRNTAGIFNPDLASQIGQEFGIQTQGRFNALNRINNAGSGFGDIRQELDLVNRQINSGGLRGQARAEAERKRRELEEAQRLNPSSLAARDLRNDIDRKLQTTTDANQRNELLRQKGLSDVDLITEDEVRKLREKQDKLNQAQQDAATAYQDAANKLLDNANKQAEILELMRKLNEDNANFFKQEITNFSQNASAIIGQYMQEIRDIAKRYLENTNNAQQIVQIETKPIQVNVALTAPDIMKTFGPAIGEQVITAIIPKISEAFGIAGSPDAASYVRNIVARAA